MGEKKRHSSFDEFDAKLKKLQASDKADADLPEHGGAKNAGLGMGMQVGIELVSGTIGGMLIGLGLDYWLGTKPLMLVLFVVLGIGAGMLNAHRYLKKLQLADEVRNDEGNRRT